jgi:hypothetical protein
MRKVIVSEFVSLDGVMEDPRWTFRFMSEERENFKYEDLRLKRQPGKDILVFGSGRLVTTLMQHDLIDE